MRRETTSRERELEHSPIKPGEIFEPEEALKNIQKESRENRPKKIEAYKQKLAYQKNGIAELQVAILDTITKNRSASPDDLKKLADQYATQYGISPDQQKHTDKIGRAHV